MNNKTSTQLRAACFFDGNFNLSVFHNLAHSENHRVLNYSTQMRLVEFILTVNLVAGSRIQEARVCRSAWFHGLRKSAKGIDPTIYQFLAESATALHLRHTTEVGKEVGVDVALSLQAFEEAHADAYDVAVIFTGDSDFCPMISKLRSLGKGTVVVGWDLPERPPHVMNGIITSRTLKDACDLYIPMDQVITNSAEWGVPQALITDLFKDSRPRTLQTYLKLMTMPEATQAEVDEVESIYSPKLPALGQKGVTGVVDALTPLQGDFYAVWIRPDGLLPEDTRHNNIPFFVSGEQHKAYVAGMKVMFDVHPVATDKKHGRKAVNLVPLSPSLPVQRTIVPPPARPIFQSFIIPPSMRSKVETTFTSLEDENGRFAVGAVKYKCSCGYEGWFMGTTAKHLRDTVGVFSPNPLGVTITHDQHENPATLDFTEAKYFTKENGQIKEVDPNTTF